ncbi:tetratricopeptide repeat protein [Actinoplanes philippinensis]|uniref:tetratricopeptide repeat protein n=1 Tax=Actinoplanes philippinensis TaxID=35752 RepID=UPI0033D57796
MTTTPSPADMAFALVVQGRFGDAETVMLREVEAVTARHGEGSPEWASAQCDLGNVLLNTEQLDRAIECFRQAATVTPRDHESRKDRLTLRLTVGQALRRAGRLDEAEAELRKGVEERLAFYGREHAGYALGLEPLASVLLERGDVAGARQAVEETVANFWNNGHERLASALALRAAVVLAGGAGEPLFAPLDQLPDHVVEQLAGSTEHLRVEDGVARKELLTALVTVLDQRLGPDHKATRNARAVLVNACHDIGDHAGRIDAIGRMLAGTDRQGRRMEAVVAALGLAMAQSDAGDIEAALRTYAGAHERARRIGRPQLESLVLRDWGLALQEAGRPGPAGQRLTPALDPAGDLTIGAHLKRAPTEAELIRLNEVFATAQAEFRRRLSDSGSAG